MSELGDTFKAWREVKRTKKLSNRELSLHHLQKNGFDIQEFETSHYLVEQNFDFWPSTGKYLDRTTKRFGRGVFNLVRDIKQRRIKEGKTE